MTCKNCTGKNSYIINFRYGFKRQNNAPQRASSARDVRLPNGGGSETTDGAAPDEDFDDGIVVDIQQVSGWRKNYEIRNSSSTDVPCN